MRKSNLRRAAFLVLIASFSAAAAFTGRIAADGDLAAPTEPNTSTQPATKAATPTGDWFGAREKQAVASDDIDTAMFAKLYPSLAKADKEIRDATPRIVYDALDSKGKPQLKLPRMHMLYQAFTAASWRDYLASRPRQPFIQIPDERVARIAAIDARNKNASLCLDIETLPVDIRGDSPETVDRSVRLLAKSVGWARAQDPNVRLFLYGCFPTSDNYIGSQIAGTATTRPEGANYAWWKTVTPDFEKRFAAWQSANQRLGRAGTPESRVAASALSSLFDGVCPSLYFYDGPEVPESDWVPALRAFARSAIDESQQYNKPVYPFVCFYLLETPKIVPLKLWITLMREILIHADGIVLWDGPNPWSEEKTLRTRIVTLLAERQGQMADDEVFAALRKEFPNNAEVLAISSPSQQTPTPQR